MIDLTGLRGALVRVRDMFKTRDFIFHDGRDLRRFSIAARTQASLAVAGAITLGFSAYGVAQVGAHAIALTGLAGKPLTAEGRVAQMEAQVADMQARIQQIRTVADIRAKRVEARQAMLAAAITGQGAVQPVAYLPVDPAAAQVAADVVAPLARVEHDQVGLAIRARQATERRYLAAVQRARMVGIDPARFLPRVPAMGGPLIPADSAEATADMAADAQFRALFQTWKKLDTLEDGLISIPSVQPVTDMRFTSNFGIRSDPFRGTAAFHPGVDIPCQTGTAIYATADGVIDRAERANGYGNLVEIDHGRGIQTRFGHLSKILVVPGQHVKRGQLIALSGSTGRSTGPHLHYEVRIDGRAVNPMPFLTTANYSMALRSPELNAVPVSSEAASDSAD